MRCLGTPAIFKWPGEHIYIGLQVELAVSSFSAWASELPVPGHRFFRSLTATEVAVGFLTQLQRLQGPSVKPVTHSTQLAVGLLLFC